MTTQRKGKAARTQRAYALYREGEFVDANDVGTFYGADSDPDGPYGSSEPVLVVPEEALCTQGNHLKLGPYATWCPQCGAHRAPEPSARWTRPAILRVGRTR